MRVAAAARLPAAQYIRQPSGECTLGSGGLSSPGHRLGTVRAFADRAGAKTARSGRWLRPGPRASVAPRPGAQALLGRPGGSASRPAQVRRRAGHAAASPFRSARGAVYRPATHKRPDGGPRRWPAAERPGGRAEDEDVLVHDQVPGLAAGAGLAGVVELEERRAGYQLAAADPGEQGDAALDRDQAGGAAGLDDGAGEVGQLAVVAPGPGGDHGDTAGPQQRGAAGEDLGDAVGQAVGAGVGEVGRVGAVAVVVLGHPARAGADVAVDARPVRRGGDHQRHPSLSPAGASLRELAGVAADHLGVPGGALPPGQRDPVGGDSGPAGLVLDADAVAAEVDGLDQGGADAAHRVGDQVARGGVAGDRGGGDGRQHLAWVGQRGRRVAAGALGAGVALRGGPHRQRRIIAVARDFRASGRCPSPMRAGAGRGQSWRVPPGWTNSSRSVCTGRCRVSAGPGRGGGRAAVPEG